MPDETAALARHGFRELGDAVGGIGTIHRAIARRAFGASGAGARPMQAVHDAVAGAVYSGLRHAALAAGDGATRALAARSAVAEPPLSSTPRGALALGALNGLIGDRLEEEGSELAQAMTVRVGGDRVGIDAESLAAAFPDATPLIVVFLHGLMETEFAWRYGAGPDGETYGARLRRELGFTPVEVRYNTGRHISQNGRSLADLLEQLAAAWPVEAERIALVGHSMGGLVARSACHQAALDEAAWVRRVRHVVSLGSPHFGAPLAQAVHVASAALNVAPETRALSALLGRRSAGIRDLRHGSLVDADWDGHDPEALRAAACEEVPLLEGATHCFVTATVTRSARHPVGRLVGDWLVLQGSGSGRSRRRRIAFRDEDGLHIGGAHHLALLNHPQVYERLREWLAPDAPA